MKTPKARLTMADVKKFQAERAKKDAYKKLVSEVEAAGELEDAIASIRYFQEELAKAKSKAQKAFDALTVQLGYAEADKIKQLMMGMNQFCTDPTLQTYKAFDRHGNAITVTIPED